MTEPKWEAVTVNICRLPVPGGWLYSYSDNDKVLVFVPDPEFYRNLDDGGVKFHDVE